MANTFYRRGPRTDTLAPALSCGTDRSLCSEYVYLVFSHAETLPGSVREAMAIKLREFLDRNLEDA